MASKIRSALDTAVIQALGSHRTQLAAELAALKKPFRTEEEVAKDLADVELRLKSVDPDILSLAEEEEVAQAQTAAAAQRELDAAADERAHPAEKPIGVKVIR